MNKNKPNALSGKKPPLLHRVLLRIPFYRKLIIFLGKDSSRYKSYYKSLHFDTTEGISLSDVDHYKNEGADSKIEQLVQNLAKHIPAPSSVLDIGCGTGRYIKQMQNQWPRANFEGIDISAEIVEKFTRKHIPGVPIHISDIETDELFHTRHPGKFNLITLIAIIQILSLKRISQILTKINAISKPGGFLYLQFNVETPGKKSSLGYKRYSIEELSALLERSGFQVIKSGRTDILQDYAFIIAKKPA